MDLVGNNLALRLLHIDVQSSHYIHSAGCSALHTQLENGTIESILRATTQGIRLPIT
jgi:hypothetical protein